MNNEKIKYKFLYQEPFPEYFGRNTDFCIFPTIMKLVSNIVQSLKSLGLL